MSDFTPHEAPVKEATALPVTPPVKLVGRETALAQVYAQLKENHPVLIHGPAGSGKTALAATLAGIYSQQPGGVLWLSVNDPQLDELLVRVGRAYQVEDITRSETPTAMIGAVENVLRSNKPFIVLDGTIDGDVLSRFISRCVHDLPILIATEPKLDGPWAALGLTKLEPEQATALFKQESRLTVDDHDIDVYGIVKVANYLPLAIVVGARSMILGKQMPGEYLKILQQMANATGGNGPIAAVTASFRSLTGALQGLVLMMGATFNGQASDELLSMISGAPLESVQQAMNILSQLNLIQRSQRYGTFYYKMHPIVHAFAQASLRGSNRLEDLQKKVRDSVVAYAQKNKGNFDKLAMEMENFLATARWSVDHDNRQPASELVSVINGAFVAERGYLYELLKLRALGAESSTAFPAYGLPEDAILPDDDEDLYDEDDDDDDIFDEVDDDIFEEMTEDSEELASLDEEINLDSQDISELRANILKVRQTGDKEKQITLLKALGREQVNAGMENEAIATYGEALNVYEDMDSEDGLLEILNTLSRLMAETDNYQAAVMNAARGIKLAQTPDTEATRLELYITLGDARQQLGESSSAVTDYTSALNLARKRQEPEQEAIILYKLGYAQLDDGEAEEAIETWERALALFKSQEKRQYEGKVLGGLGSAYGDLDRWSEAINFHTSALYIAREVKDKEEEGQQLNSLGYAATQAGQLGDAVLRYRQALHLAYETDDADQIVSIIVDLARLLVESRKHVSVAELLIDDALTYETTDKDVNQLKERIDSERKLAEAYQVEMIPIHGTAQTYASNAYKLLDS